MTTASLPTLTEAVPEHFFRARRLRAVDEGRARGARLDEGPEFVLLPSRARASSIAWAGRRPSIGAA